MWIFPSWSWEVRNSMMITTTIIIIIINSSTVLKETLAQYRTWETPVLERHLKKSYEGLSDCCVSYSKLGKSIKGTTHNNSKLVFQQIHARFLEREKQLRRNSWEILWGFYTYFWIKVHDWQFGQRVPCFHSVSKHEYKFLICLLAFCIFHTSYSVDTCNTSGQCFPTRVPWSIVKGCAKK
jgi:hypothetical protein